MAAVDAVAKKDARVEAERGELREGDGRVVEEVGGVEEAQAVGDVRGGEGADVLAQSERRHA